MPKVELAVYDLSRGMAIMLSQQILGQRIDGIWHTGIVVFGKEYYFGGGIQVARSGVFAMQNNLPATQMLDMGETSKTQSELEAHLRSISSSFTQATYDLISNNCNNFSDNICLFLTGHRIPERIVDLPRIVFSTPGGAMLRPMIENMQRNINQQATAGGGGLDPFGAHSQQQQMFNHQHDPAHVTQAAVHSLLGSNNNTTTATTAAAVNVPSTLVLAELEESSLLSGDASALNAIVQKIFKAQRSTDVVAAAVVEPLLDEQQRNMLEATVAIIQQQSTAGSNNSSSRGSDANGQRYPLGCYALLLHILKQQPQLQFPVYFLLRLLLLHDDTDLLATSNTQYKSDYLSLITHLTEQLLLQQQIDAATAAATTAVDATVTADVDKDKDNAAFKSIGGCVMALCCLSNALSRRNFWLLLRNLEDNSSSSLLTALVDIATAGVHHSRVEVRQMAATLAYNFALANSSNNNNNNDNSSVWVTTAAAGSEMHSTAVPLLCACLERIASGSESDAGVRFRLLAVVCRIVRVFGALATALIDDLGYSDMINYLQQHQQQGISTSSPPLSKAELAVVQELSYRLAAH